MRRIKKAAIKFISLVPAGANQIEPVYKSDGSVSFGTLVKSSANFDDQGELTAVVYAPNMRDAQGDIADADVVKQMAHDFIANGASVDINHDGKPLPKEKARVAETFLVQKSDERFHGWKDTKGNPVDLAGAWATIIKIEDPELRKKYRSGDWAGVSMGGTAVVESEKSSDVVSRLAEALNQLTARTSNAEPVTKSTDMTPQELEAVLTKSNQTVLAGVAELLKGVAPKQENKDAAKPSAPPSHVLNNERLLKKWQREQERNGLYEATLAKGDYAGYREGLAEMKKAWAEEDAEEQRAKAGPEGTPAETVEKGQLPKELGGLPLDKSDALAVQAGVLLAKSLEKAKA